MTQPQRQPIPDTNPVALLHELNLGQHTLFIMDDRSIYLLMDDEQMDGLTNKGIHLGSIETYQLFISLQEEFWKKM